MDAVTLNAALALAAIAGAILMGAISPGPSFVLVARTAIAVSRRDGLAAALGMGVGGVIFAALALAGLAALLTQFAWLHLLLKLTGGAYLLYLAVMLWRGARQPVAFSDATALISRQSLGRSFWIALATQISNPKAIVIYTGIFAALMPKAPPNWFYAVVPLIIFVIETGWYVAVSLLFSARRPRAAYLRLKLWVDRAAAAVLGLLGARLLSEAARQT